MNDDNKSTRSAGPAPAKPTKHEEMRAKILAAQAVREAAEEAARGPLGSARRKARTNWAASESRPPRKPLGRPAGK